MERLFIVALAAAALAGGSMWAWSARATPEDRSDTEPEPADVASARTEPIQPLPAPLAPPAAKVALGKRLFEETALSDDGTISCASCHDLANGGADGRPRPAGIHGRAGATNAPTVFNADFNPKQFWDGRADSLETQIDGPILNPLEMGATWNAIVQKLRRDPAYAREFAMYRDGVTPANIKDAIATYERTLVTTGSRFDRWLLADPDALTAQELHGYSLFKAYGCISCHQGHNVGGNVFETLGVMGGDYFADRGEPIEPADLGRFNVTHQPADKYRFRVPSLRLVAKTAPYFHDGRVPTLEAAITLMGKYQLGTEIPSLDVADIAAFLKTLAPE